MTLSSFHALTKISEAQGLLIEVHKRGVVDARQAVEVLGSALDVLKQRTTSCSALHEVEVILRKLLPVLDGARTALLRMERDAEDVSDFLEELVSPRDASDEAQAAV